MNVDAEITNHKNDSMFSRKYFYSDKKSLILCGRKHSTLASYF